MKKLTALILTCCLCLFMFAGCGGGNDATTSSTSAESSAAAENTSGEKTVTDVSGNEVTIPTEVDSIVNLWPSYTASLYVLGAGDLVKAQAQNGLVNSWTEFFYPNAANVPALGGTTPNVEEVAKLDPDFVIVHPSSISSGYPDQLKELGIPALDLNLDSYDTMVDSYTVLGEALGGEYQDKTEKLCDMIQEKLSRAEELTADLSDEDKPVVYYITGMNDSLTATAGADSMQQSWVETCGGIFASANLNINQDTSEVTAEEVFAANPDVIFVGNTYQHKLIEELQTMDGWKDLNAVKNGRVYGIPYGCFGWDRYGMESTLLIDYALSCIQPEIAEENGIDHDYLVNEVIDFYKTFNGTEMTTEQAENMLNGLTPDGAIELDETAAQGGGQN